MLCISGTENQDVGWLLNVSNMVTQHAVHVVCWLGPSNMLVIRDVFDGCRLTQTSIGVVCWLFNEMERDGESKGCGEERVATTISGTN